MSKKESLKDLTDARAIRILYLRELYPPYYDEGWNYRIRGKMTLKKWRSAITGYEYRMYRTWKYNRKTQYK